MSASREKKKRQEISASGAVDPRAARAAEQRAAERKSNILYGTVAAVFVVVAVALVVYNSGIIQRNQTAAVIGGEKYTVPQVAYYYQQICNNYASMFGQEYLQSLKTQSYDDSQTWNDYFKSEAVNTMKFIHAAKTAAKEAGLTLEAEDKETVKANVDGMKSAAAAAGYGYGAYLKALYGATMTSGVFESCLEDQILASKYATQYSDENFVYSDEEIQKYYEENKNSYDVVDAAYITISGKPEAKTDDEGNTIEATDEEKAAAMDEAKEMAEDILDVYKTSRALPEDYDEKAVYTANEEMGYSSGVLGDWLFDEGRKAGDAEVLVDESGRPLLCGRVQRPRAPGGPGVQRPPHPGDRGEPGPPRGGDRHRGAAHRQGPGDPGRLGRHRGGLRQAGGGVLQGRRQQHQRRPLRGRAPGPHGGSLPGLVL